MKQKGFENQPWDNPEEYVDLAKKQNLTGDELKKYMEKRQIPEPKIGKK